MQHAVWSYNAVVYEMNVRQLTEDGSFVMAMRHLQHLKEVGVDVVWLMPIYNRICPTGHGAHNFITRGNHALPADKSGQLIQHASTPGR